jgi:hypothetical protein
MGFHSVLLSAALRMGWEGAKSTPLSGTATVEARRLLRPRRMTTAKTRAKRAPAQKAKPRRAGRKWSQHVNETSNALDLEPGVFLKDSPRAIADSLKRSADRSRRRKTDAYRSAMSMLTFYVNRAGKNLSAARVRTLEAAKGELRVVYGRAPS